MKVKTIEIIFEGGSYIPEHVDEEMYVAAYIKEKIVDLEDAGFELVDFEYKYPNYIATYEEFEE